MQDNAAALIAKLQRSINIVHNPVAGWVILFLSLVITFAAYWITNRQVSARAEEHFLFRANEISIAIRQRLMLYEQALQGGRGLFSASNTVTRDEWARYVGALHLEERLPGIQGIGFAKAMPASERESHEAEVQAEGFGDYRIKPDGEREFYTSIVYIEPFDWRNRRAFGYDMWSNDVRRDAMARARDTGEPATSGSITLVQETNRNVQKGFLIYVPVYASVEVPATLEERRQQLSGWVYAPFRMRDLMRGVLDSGDANISFAIYDTDVPSDENLLLRYGYEGAEEAHLIEPNLFRVRLLLSLPGRTWTVSFRAPQKALMEMQDAPQPLYVLVAGIIIDLLLFYVIMSLHYINRHARLIHKKMQLEFERNQQALAEQTRLVQATEKESETFFELAPAAFLVVSPQGFIVRANRFAHELLQYGMDELAGKSVEELVPQELRADHMELRGNYFNRAAPSLMDPNHTLQVRKRDGESFPAMISLVPVELRGETHVVAVVHDLSQQKQVEQTLADAKEKAESASRAKTEFVANMSHEIRTPLNAVLGAAQLLEKTEHNPDQQRYIRMIRSSGEALLGVINDILDFSKIEAGRMELAPVHFDLDEVLARIAVMMAVHSAEKDIELVVRVEPAVGRHLLGDPLRLQQVLLNLVSNAIKFTQEGEVVLVVEVAATDADGQQTLRFSVRDTGIGMTLQQQTRIFEAFSQADASITRRFGGTGLGLVISSKIVALMGSRLRVISEPEIGSEFSFDLELPSAPVPAGRGHAVLDHPRHLLLVDKHLETQLAVKAILDRWGWSLTTCNDIEDARHVLAGNIGTIHFMLLSCNQAEAGCADAFLSEVDLSPLCRRVLLIRNNQSALLTTADVQRRFDAVMVKPVLEASMLNTLMEAMRHSAGERLVLTAGAPAQLSGLRVLLVEDNPLNQTVAAGLLEDMGAHIAIANNGAEAVDMVQQSPADFDVILMDIQMPVMDGMTATRRLRDAGYKHPIIAMTAEVQMAERGDYLAVGMNDLVPKPVDAQQLWHAISLAKAGESTCRLPQVAQEVQERPVFDQARLEKLTQGRPERVQSIVQSLAEIERQTEAGLENALHLIRRGELKPARPVLHNIKGVLANYGGAQVAERIQALETAIDADIPAAELAVQVELIRQHFTDYVEQARKWSRAQEKLYG